MNQLQYISPGNILSDTLTYTASDGLNTFLQVKIDISVSISSITTAATSPGATSTASSATTSSVASYIGAGVGALVVLIVIILVVVFVIRRRKSSSQIPESVQLSAGLVISFKTYRTLVNPQINYAHPETNYARVNALKLS